MRFPGAERAQELLNQAQRVRIPAKRSQRLSEPLVDGPPEPGLDVARGPGTDEPGSSPSRSSVPAVTALRRPAGDEIGSRFRGSVPRRFGFRISIGGIQGRKAAETGFEPRVRERVARTALRATSRSGESLTLLPFGESGDEARFD